MKNLRKSIETFQRYKGACKTVSKELLASPPPDPALDQRQEFYLDLLAEYNLLRPGVLMADLGGGDSWFIVVLAQMGLDATLVDDFGGGGHSEMSVYRQHLGFLETFKKLGVKIYSQDLLSKPLPFPDQTLDVITCFHCLEHWHNSPKKLFGEIRRVLKPDGHIIFATPNAVNLRKRLYALAGSNPFDNLDEWYQQEIFRGHVREPSIADLKKICQWNSFQTVSIYGRNFIGQDSVALSFLPAAVRRFAAKASALLLQTMPSLCSDIHIVGVKR